MIRSKGEAGTGDIVEAVRHLREISGDIKPPADARRRPSSRPRPRSSRRRSTSSAQRRRDGQPAGRAVLRRRHRHAGRRLAGDAARRRGRVRRLGDLQVRGSRAPRARAIVEATTHFADPERVAARLRRASGTPMASLESSSSRTSSCWRHAAGSTWRRRDRRPKRWSASSRCRADFEAHARMLRALGRRAARGSRAGRPRRPRRARAPRRRVDDDDARDRARGPAEPLRELAARGHAGARHLRRADHARPRPPRPDRHARASATRSAARSARFEADLDVAGVDGAPVRAVFIRAPWIAEHGPGVEVLAAVDGHAVAARQGDVLAVAFHPELGRRRRACTGCSSGWSTTRARPRRNGRRRRPEGPRAAAAAGCARAARRYTLRSAGRVSWTCADLARRRRAHRRRRASWRPELAQRGHEPLVHGALARRGADGLGVGQSEAAARDVAEGRAEQAVVCCWTGTGASIAANKVPGVRAALCLDAATAAGARRWNDANVLALSLRATSAGRARGDPRRVVRRRGERRRRRPRERRRTWPRSTSAGARSLGPRATLGAANVTTPSRSLLDDAPSLSSRSTWPSTSRQRQVRLRDRDVAPQRLRDLVRGARLARRSGRGSSRAPARCRREALVDQRDVVGDRRRRGRAARARASIARVARSDCDVVTQRLRARRACCRRSAPSGRAISGLEEMCAIRWSAASSDRAARSSQEDGVRRGCGRGGAAPAACGRAARARRRRRAGA